MNPSDPSILAPSSVASPERLRCEATLGAAFERRGRGLHTARAVTVRVSPAPAGTGILFRRSLRGGRVITVPALWDRRVSQPLCTALQDGDGLLIRTVEHLLAALSALRIDNAEIALDAEELPIFDGSAKPWCAAIREAGRVVGGMTVPDEPVRHRILDLVGDLSLAGHPILGHVTAAHTGHELNHALVARLMGEPSAWERATVRDG